MADAPATIPLHLVTGFLGSGKTTLLADLARRYADRRVVFLVNDFSPVDVDGAVLRDSADDVVAVAGGSIFCRCLVTEFINRLQDIPARFGSEDQPVECVVVEASGVADPRVTGRMLYETGLNNTYRLGRIVAVVDPGSFVKLLSTLPAMRAQVEAADTILINKTDCYDEAEIDNTEAAVRETAPKAAILRTVECAGAVDLFDNAASGAEGEGEGDYAACADPSYVALTASFSRPVEAGPLLTALNDLRPDIFRAKGLVPTTGGAMWVDVSASGVRTRLAVDGTAADHALVVIAPGWRDGPARDFVARFGAG